MNCWFSLLVVFFYVKLPNVSQAHDLLDCRRLYIDTNHFSHAADEIAHPLQIGYYCGVCTEYLHVQCTKFKQKGINKSYGILICCSIFTQQICFLIRKTFLLEFRM